MRSRLRPATRQPDYELIKGVQAGPGASLLVADLRSRLKTTEVHTQESRSKIRTKHRNIQVLLDGVDFIVKNNISIGLSLSLSICMM